MMVRPFSFFVFSYFHMENDFIFFSSYFHMENDVTADVEDQVAAGMPADDLPSKWNSFACM